jgi:Glucose inhibited division protein A
MVRGQWLVDRAIEEKLIGNASDDPRALLVVGAGAAGATAALRAARSGVRTVLAEVAALPFLRQLGCATRFIDPTQYDWPAAHWSVGSCPPWPSPTLPLSWTADFANVLAARWSMQFAASAAVLPLLTTLFSTSVTIHPWIGAPASPSRVRVTLTQGARFATRQFGAVILARGFGTERHAAPSSSGGPDFTGFRFWDTDPFAMHPLAAKKVLISGGGDGALQDFIRICTGRRSAADVLAALIPSPQREEIGARLYSHQDQALRAYSWGSRPSHDHAVHSSLEKHQRIEISGLRASPLWGSIQKTAAAWFAASGVTRIDLVHPCTHFQQGYALNQFLTLLLVGALAGSARRRMSTAVATVDCLHAGPTHPGACVGRDHDVAMAGASCGASGLPSGSPERFDLVVIRHGIAPVAKPGKPHSNPWSRHVLPFNVPM